MSISNAKQKVPSAPRWVALWAGAAALLAGGCVDNDTSMTVEGVLAPRAPACDVVADPGSSHLLQGVLDIELGKSYQALVLVGNQLTPRGNKVQLRAEAQAINLEGAEVRVLDDAGREAIDAYTVQFGGFVRPNTSSQPGYAAASVTLVPPEVVALYADDLVDGSRKQVVSAVRVFGTTLGGVEVTSSEYMFSVTLCRGCLIEFPLEALDDSGNCSDDVKPPDGDPPCRIGQDDPVDCRLCSTTETACARLP